MIQVLYAEDEPIIAVLVQSFLQHNAPECQLEVVPDGAACLKRMAAGGVDVLMVDMMLPDINGLQIIGELVARGDPTPIIMVSSHGHNELAVQALRAGAVDCIDKTTPQFLQIGEIVRHTHARHLRRKQVARLIPSRSTPWHLLCLEADAGLCASWRNFLAQNAPNLELTAAASHEDFTQLLHGPRRVDAVLIGPDPGRASALDILREVRSLPEAIPAVVVAPQGDSDTAIAAIKLGAHDYLKLAPGYLPELVMSLNVALRQEMDLYQCVRPVRYFKGIPSPLKDPSKTDMVIFRENTEDIYCGVEWQAESAPAKKLIKFLQEEMGVTKIRFPNTSGIGIKPVSREGTERLMRAAVNYAITNKRKSVTIVHKGNIMKYTEGGFRDWAYALAKSEFGGVEIDGGPWCKVTNPHTGREIVIKDSIADAFLQQVLLRPAEYDVIATTNLNGDYISDALAAQVGGIGIAPGANISDQYACFEATHGTAPKYAGLDKVNPGSLILSAEMMLRHLGWKEAANLVIKAMESAIGDRKVTYDFARMMDGADELSCSEFGDALIERM